MLLANPSSDFLISRTDPNYPPHHTGDHLEEFFLKFWEAEGSGERKLIPVHWTAVYNHKVKEGLGCNTPNGLLRSKLQKYLDTLDPREKYFIVCTHDDAPAEKLPPDTVVFAAGGNAKKIDYAIPLTCGPHTGVQDPVRTVFCSFVGSVTHPLRERVLRALYQKPGVMIDATVWQESVQQDRARTFKNIAQNSIFSLCPRGYGATSYRLYESIQLGSIPVYVSDRQLLPWSDEIDWKDFCVLVSPHEIDGLYERLTAMTGSQVRKMQDRLAGLHENYFTVEASCKHILKRIK
jgi:hypothetical protein